MKKTLAAAGAVVLALGLSSCGGGGDDAAASKSLSDSIMKSQNAGSGAASSLLDLKQKEADCIGQGMVDKIGTDQLIQYKILTKDNKASKDVTAAKMSKGDAATATDVLFGCTDVPGMMNKAMTSSGQVPKEMRACVTKALNDSALRGMFTEVFAGNQDAAKQKLIQPMMKCAQPSAG
ncbi:MAG: hypothetical protein ABIQ59_06000 [Nocardioidaceae bacterium]